MRANRTVAISSVTIGILILLAMLAPINMSRGIIKITNGTPSGWTDDINLSNDTVLDRNPRIKICSDKINIVWEKQISDHIEIFYRNSTTSGQNWNNPVNLTGGISGIYCRNPDIGVNSSHIHVIWEDNDAIGREIKYRNSTDGGITWSATKMISTDDGEYSEGTLIGVYNLSINVIWVD